MALNSKLGFPVSTRTFSLLEMVAREWGSEFRSPDHRVYRFTGRDYDSTDLGFTGLYGQVQAIAAPTRTSGIFDKTASSLVLTADSDQVTADGGRINY